MYSFLLDEVCCEKIQPKKQTLQIDESSKNMDDFQHYSDRIRELFGYIKFRCKPAHMWRLFNIKSISNDTTEIQNGNIDEFET